MLFVNFSRNSQRLHFLQVEIFFFTFLYTNEKLVVELAGVPCNLLFFAWEQEQIENFDSGIQK